MSEPDFIVVRPAADLPEGFLPPGVDGRWLDKSQLPPMSKTGLSDPVVTGSVVPTGRFEVREEDGAVAEVYEVRRASDG